MPSPCWPVLAPAPSGAPTRSPAATWSVVIAAYQAERTIADAIRSVLEQTVPPTEVVVCDDGSTDGTAAVVQGMGGAVRLVRQANRGEGAAKNAAVLAARGEFVVVLDADDVFLPRRLEALTWLAQERPDLDVLVTDAYVDVDGVAVHRAYHRDWPFPADHQRLAILARNFVLGHAAVRRDRWLEVDGFDEGLHHASDWDFFLRLVLSGSAVGLVDVPLARYRLAPGSLSSNRDELVSARLEVLRRALTGQDLAPAERAVAEQAVREQTAGLAVLRARRSLADRPSTSRLAALRTGLRPGVPGRDRMALAAGAVAPGWVGRRWQQRVGVELSGGVSLRSDGSLIGSRDLGGTDAEAVCWLRGVALAPSLRPLRVGVLPAAVVGAPDLPVHAVLGPSELVDAHAAGADPPDLVAARLRRNGVRLRWAAPVLEPELSRLLATARRDGAASLLRLRSEPELLAWTRLGAWSQSPWTVRSLRRLALQVPVPALLGPSLREDAAYWQGVRSVATEREWARLTRSYVTLAYHRIAGEHRPGQERYDVRPERFRRQLRLLLLLGWRPLTPEQLAAAHGGGGVLPRRRFVVTLDDGYADAVEAAVGMRQARPHVYLPTDEVGSVPAWGGGARLADWEEVEAAAAAGVVIGSHARRHRPLTEQDDAALTDELAGSLAALVAHGQGAVPLLAYPNGRYDERVRDAAVQAGYAGAWTTLPGRNSAASDAWSLRRISVKDWDGPLSFLWKVVTGEPVPAPVEVLTQRWWARRQRPAEHAGRVTWRR